MKIGKIGKLNSQNVRSSTPPPPEEITDALIMEDGTLFLMENGNYFKLEK